MVQQTDDDLVRITGEIVAAYVARNEMDPKDVPAMIESVLRTLRTQAGAVPAAASAAAARAPAVAVEDSIQPDFIVCLEDGKQLRVLTRYLRRAYGLSPQQYRERWGLPKDYPMAAPNLSKLRSKQARNTGLGRPAEAVRKPKQAASKQTRRAR